MAYEQYSVYGWMACEQYSVRMDGVLHEQYSVLIDDVYDQYCVRMDGL